MEEDQAAVLLCLGQGSGQGFLGGDQFLFGGGILRGILCNDLPGCTRCKKE